MKILEIRIDAGYTYYTDNVNLDQMTDRLVEFVMSQTLQKVMMLVWVHYLML